MCFYLLVSGYCNKKPNLLLYKKRCNATNPEQERRPPLARQRRGRDRTGMRPGRRGRTWPGTPARTGTAGEGETLKNIWYLERKETVSKMVKIN